MHIRPFHHLDLPEIITLDRISSDPDNWVAEDYNDMLSGIGINMWAVENRGRIVGVMIFGVVERKIIVHRLIVHPDYRRGGVATMLLSDLDFAAQRDGKRYIEAMINEYEVSAQKLLKKCGYRCVKIAYKYHCDGDGYKFRRVVQIPVAEIVDADIVF